MTRIRQLPTLLIAFCIIATGIGCTNNDRNKKITKKRTPIQRIQPPAFTYSLVKTADWLKQQKDSGTALNMNILTAVNRTDTTNLKKLDSILVPTSFTGDIGYYMHFPIQVPALDEVDKIILFNYATQTFATFEFGELMHTGPTNMGRKANPTPVGLYFCNWKAEETISTFNDEWELKWNFNIENKEGIGFHQYELPGYPASHSCLRLREADAKLIYNWADQWKLNDDDEVLFKGTPVIVFGTYPFDGPKPWLALASNTAALDMTVAAVETVLQPHLPAIKNAVRTRNIEQMDSTDM